MDEIAAFLRAHPPFDAIAPDELDRLAAAAETCAFAAGETIFAQGAAPQTSVWIVCSGGVELVDHGRVLDLLGPGELFGFSSMLAELPTGFAARAYGETACYRLPGDATRPLLARRASLRHVTRTILGRPVKGVARAEGAGPAAEGSPKHLISSFVAFLSNDERGPVARFFPSSFQRPAKNLKMSPRTQSGNPCPTLSTSV